MLGRDFLPEDDKRNGRKVVLISYKLWQRRFSGSADVIGKMVRIDDSWFAVVGVLPANAVFPGDADFWMPLGIYRVDDLRFLEGVGRLKAGVNIAQASADLLRVHKGMIPQRKENEATQPAMVPLREHYLGGYRIVSDVMLAAVGLVLLIACVNIGNLMMVRGSARVHELAIRSALGAGQGTLIRQTLGESAVLAAIGGAVGLGLGWMMLHLLLSLMPDVLPSWVEFHLDFRVLLFAILVTGAAALAAALLPALQFSKGAVRDVLLDAGPRSSSGRGRRRLMNILLVAEVALAILLLQAGGLVLKAYWQVAGADPGFRAENVVTFALDPPGVKGKVAFYDTLLARLRSSPGVEAVGASTNLPLGVSRGVATLEIVRTLRPGAGAPGERTEAQFIVPGYFHAMGVAILAGRDFDDHDSNAIIVNESLARRLWPGETSVVGRKVESEGKAWTSLVVAGVVRDVRLDALDREVRPEAYLVWRQNPFSQLFVVVRSQVDAAAVLSLSRNIVHSLDANMALYDVRLMQDRVDRSLWMRRTYSWLLGAFSGMGLLVAVAGIYGVISYAVTQRRRELAIRMALGARPNQVVSQVLRGGMVAVSLGFTIGMLGAFYLAQALRTVLVSVSPYDGKVVAVVNAILLGTALLAMSIPARRAASIHPAQSLRSD